MPKKYGVKEKDLVVDHVVNMVLTGRLRSGDRLDRNEIAHELGLSRVPVQEAVVQLEHDGILSTRYHRGAYVEKFDESTVREHHELYGVLCGVASGRAAAASDPAVIADLEAVIAQMRSGRDSRQFDSHARRFRSVINGEYAGPRLQAAIDASRTLIPPTFLAVLPAAQRSAAALLRGRAHRDPRPGPRRRPHRLRATVRRDGRRTADRAGASRRAAQVTHGPPRRTTLL